MLSSILASFLFAAIPVEWSVDTFRVKPFVYDCYHGETLDLAASMTAYGTPLDLAGKTAKLYWSTNATATAWWTTNATVAASGSLTNILAATFSGAYDTGANETYGFIGVDGENYRAAFTLRFRHSPGFVPSSLPVPMTVIDCAAVTFLNPTNAPWAVGGGSGGVDTNAVSGIITNHVDSGYLCTVAAAAAMTNDASIVRFIDDLAPGAKRIFVPGTSDGFNGLVLFYNGFYRRIQSGAKTYEITSYILPNVGGTLALAATTLSGYGIMDAYTKDEVDAAISPLSSSVSNLSSRVSGLSSSKRDLTNNVCAADSFSYSAWSKDNLPSGVTWDDQPFIADDGLWTWHYVDGSSEGYSQGEQGEDDNDTFQTFGYGEGFTSTRAKITVAISNDTFTTYAFVTNAIATLAPAPDFTTNNTVLVGTITNVAGKAGGGTASGINLHDAGLGCDWQLSVSNSVFTWTVKED